MNDKELPYKMMAKLCETIDDAPYGFRSAAISSIIYHNAPTLLLVKEQLKCDNVKIAQMLGLTDKQGAEVAKMLKMRLYDNNHVGIHSS